MARDRPNAQQRRQIAVRANYLCEYCLCPDDFSPQSFVFEHIVPVSKGGQTVLDNLAFACQGCNSHKYTKQSGIDPLTNSEHGLYNPRRDVWEKHFVWDETELLLMGKTGIGRATIDTLKLNRQRVINVRGLLMLADLHPPDM